MNKQITVAVAMSGGVDSSLAAYLLKRQGYNIIGITMKHWGGEVNEAGSKTCCSLDDIYDAKRVCDDLDISHYTINFEKDFEKEVVEYFIEEYENARTPNPCVICNRKIKLGKLVDFAKSIGADFLATGHYAILKDGNLFAGEDSIKDQAYFLSLVKKNNLKQLMFPLGEFKKEEVREMSKEFGVRVYSKRDSQEICFVQDDYKKFLLRHKKFRKPKKGPIIHKSGEILGEHNGLAFYTMGQRKGMGISYHKPLYVVGFDTEKNALIVGDNEDLFSIGLKCKEINLLGVNNLKELNNLRCKIKTRSRDKFHYGVLLINEDKTISVKFEDKVRAITSGQTAVFYNEENMVLGGGIII